MTPPEELKPCPFCGSPSIRLYLAIEWWCFCEGCKATTAMCSNRQDAVDHWNMRNPPNYPFHVKHLEQATKEPHE